ncbi:MAG: glycerol-3-phosphate dehydrogenase subunit GlpB [Trueperella sp.]|nr:glycerol-3-phosphate dehydrogenase subunit GlpB [Trueperella sp.]
MKVIVIGSGLAGMTSALLLAQAGHQVEIVNRGIGGLLLSPGTIDVFGWNDDGSPAVDPYQAAADHAQANPYHPYAATGVEAIRQGVAWLRTQVPIFARKTGEKNMLLPTPIGAVRPTAWVQKTMSASVLSNGAQLLVVGLRQFKDFPAQLLAANLNRSRLVDVTARATTVDLPVRPNEIDSTATTYARGFDGAVGLDAAQLFAQLVNALAPQVKAGDTVLLPAVLGLEPANITRLAERLGVPVGEVPTVPPSIPGRRIYQSLLTACREARIDIATNATAVGFTAEAGQIKSVQVQRAGRVTAEAADAVVHAPGGFDAGGLSRDSYGNITENVFDLPVFTPASAAADQLAVMQAGVRVDGQMHPVDAAGSPLYANLHCAGSVIGGARPWAEKSGEGIALATAWVAAQSIIAAESEQ